MAQVTKAGDATSLGLPGRNAFDVVSGRTGAQGVTFRLVEIPVEQGARPGDRPARQPHFHDDFEECIYLLSGKGVSTVDGVEHPLEAGDTILVAAGERHMTRNTGDAPLMLLCFFPVADIAPGTQEPGTHEPGIRAADGNGQSDAS